jgi:hypothetical protein
MNDHLEEIYYNDILLEARINRLLPIFNKYPDIQKNTKIKNEIQKAINILKKDDRIIWYIQWYKLYILESLKNPNFEIEKESFAKRIGLPVENIENILNKFSPTIILNKLDHYFALHIPNIDNKVFKISDNPLLVIEDFQKIETKYFEKFKGSIEEVDTDEVVIRFPDGWVWVNTHSPTCSREERQSMQHCGNEYGHQQEGDEIFSLREPVKIQNKTKWIPHLTFVVNDKVIREAKGKQNAKPVSKYHKYIIPLLKSDYITQINCAGSYDAKSNFSLKDLPKNIQAEIIELKGDEFELDTQKQLEAKIAEYNDSLRYSTIILNVDDESGEIIYSIFTTVKFNFIDFMGVSQNWHKLHPNDIRDELKLYIDIEDIWISTSERIVMIKTESKDYVDPLNETDVVEDLGTDLMYYEQQKYEKDFGEILSALIKHGVIHPTESMIFLQNIEKKYLHVDVQNWSTGDININFIIDIGNIHKIPQNVITSKIKNYFIDSKFLDKLINQEIKIITQKNPNQMEFKFKESLQHGTIVDTISVTFIPEDNDINISFNINNLMEYGHDDFRKIEKVLEFIDNNYKTIKNEIQQIIYGLFEINTPSTPIMFSDRQKFRKWYFNQLQQYIKNEKEA